MLYLTPELFVDALILVLYYPSAKNNALVTKILEIYEKEQQSSTYSENTVLNFYVDIIKYVMTRGVDLKDATQVDVMLLRFRSHPLMAKDPELYTILKRIFTEPNIDPDREKYLVRKLTNACVWYQNTQLVKKMFSKLANGATVTMPEQQEKILGEISSLCQELVQSNSTVGKEIEEGDNPNRTLAVNFGVKDEIRKAFEVHQTVSVTSRCITGLQGLNRAFNGGFPMGSSIVHNALSFNAKAVSVNIMVKIPGGWKRAGDVRVGDMLIAQDGTPTRVTGVFPQGLKQMWRVTFIDGRHSDTSEDHLWEVIKYHNYALKSEPIRIRRYSSEVMTTRQIYERMQIDYGKRNTRIPLIVPEDTPDVDLPIHPYLLGVLLGDGCIGNHNITLTTDTWIIDKIIPMFPDGVSITPIKSKENKYPDYMSAVSIANSFTKRPGPNGNTLLNQLRELGLAGHRSWEKFIPEIYLNASIEQRWQLLQGLMDTDGTVPKTTFYKGKEQYTGFGYCTTSKQLAKDIQQIIWSLGGLCKVTVRQPYFRDRDGNIKKGRLAYIMRPIVEPTEKVFSLPRKKDKIIPRNKTYQKQLAIVDVGPLPEKAECVCFTVDHPRMLFVIQDYIATHNSLMLQKYVRWQMQYNKPPANITNPTLVLISLENEVAYITNQIFTELYINVFGTVPPPDMSVDAMIDFCHQKVQEYGWKLIIERKLGAEFGTVELTACMQEYIRLGYTPLMVVIDYVNMLKKGTEGKDIGNWLALKEIYNYLCNYFKSRGCTMVTAHQLNRKAAALASVYPVGAVKRFNMDHSAEGMDPFREVDIVLYQHKDVDAAGRSFMTFKLDKDRYDPDITPSRSYFAYQFKGPLGIMDDINGEDKSITNINAVPFDDDDLINLEAAAVVNTGDTLKEESTALTLDLPTPKDMEEKVTVEALPEKVDIPKEEPKKEEEPEYVPVPDDISPLPVGDISLADARKQPTDLSSALLIGL